MITIVIALLGLGISLGGMGFLLYRHWSTLKMEGALKESINETTMSPPIFFEELFTTLKMRGMLFWQTNLRGYIFSISEKILTWCENAFKRLAAFLRIMRSRIRRRQLNGMNQEDRYWHNLNSWNSRRLKLRLRRKKSTEEE